MPLVKANGMIHLTSGPQSWTPWVPSNGGISQFLYTGAGPTSTTLWSVQVSIGLSGGDNTQYTRWIFSLCDGSGAQLAQYSGSAINWESNGKYVYGDTLTASLGSSMCLYLQIYNDDPVSQVYIVSVWAWYY